MDRKSLFITVLGCIFIVVIFLGILVLGTTILHRGMVPTPEAHYCYWDYELEEKDHLDTYYYPTNGSKFVVVTLKVVNQDDVPFSNNPYFWCLTINRVSYDISFYTFAVDEINYESVEVNRGGNYTWKIVFETPENISSTSMSIGYDNWMGPHMKQDSRLL